MKILCFTPLPYGDGSGWWSRDLALTVRGFRTLGHEAWLVCQPTTHAQDPLGRPVLLISAEKAQSPEWWQKQKPDAVVLGLWTMPKYDTIRDAALSATARVVERCDSDGIRLPSCGHKMFFRNQITAAWDRAPFGQKVLSGLIASGKCLVAEAVNPWMRHRLAQTLRRLPFFLAETPIAVDRLGALAESLGEDPRKFLQIPHPIDTDIFRLAMPMAPKRRRIVCVGRWQARQKDWPLLRSALQIFLDTHPDFDALVFGSGTPSASPHRRLLLAGLASPEKISEALQNSQILFFSSRYESFLLAGAEALCCGCSVVGPQEVVSSQYFASFFGGSPLTRRHPQALAHALHSEAEQWLEARRNPQVIASKAAAEFSYSHVAQSILSIFQGMGESRA